PFLVKNGARQSTPGYPEHLSTKEPRTAVGYDTNRTKLTMLVVDGRNAGGSAGVTQQELTDIMINLGCANAMNFDGGGSSTMYLSQFGVRNVPSSSSLDKNRPEGTPRTVVNALFAVATSPEDNEVASIEIKEKKLNLITDEEKGITVYGYNQYGVMVNSNLSGYTITLPEEIGTITGSKIKAKSGKYSGLLTVNYGNASYSIPVYLNGGGTFVDAAVAEIEIDNSDATPEYFNTMGVKLNNPVPGQIVIVRRGSKVSKEIYR
ncbi:MAG: phosphodiester glycosidase family protein, partial [Muribaculaceae bacterium]|nr:phosphodiester glycosidase family protein [Muribaculaceae bacterium]